MRKALYFLGIMSDADIEWLSRVGHHVNLPAGTVVIREGQPLENLFIVIEGVLSVTAGASGPRPIARLRAGEIVGEISFVDARPPLATVTAEEDSIVLAVPRVQLTAKLDEAPFAARFYHALSVFLADRLRHTVGQLGYGSVQGNSTEPEPASELDPSVLERMTLAGARFDGLLRRLRGA